MALPEKDQCLTTYFHKQVELPAGKILRAWTAISATHEFVLYVNGREASRSRYGRVASAFRRAEEVEDLAGFFRPGKNTLAVEVRRWSAGAPDVFLRAEVQVQAGGKVVAVPLVTDETWLGSYGPGSTWRTGKLEPARWVPAKTAPARRLTPRIRRDREQVIRPDVPAPLARSVTKALPRIAERSDWRQQVV
ncbi:MAG TPA: hypothetical protein VM031_05725, partial [Phycisphaerae bacterium]|nr:hypothetical protein [Phycisphaerae bacterium]